MKKQLLFLFILTASVSSFSQKKEKQIEMSDEVAYLLKERPILFDVIDSIFRRQKRNKEQIELFIQKSSETSYPFGKAYGYNMLGKYYRNKSNYKKAIELHKKAMDISVKIKDTHTEIVALNMIGVAYRRQDRLKQALEYHQAALELAHTIKDPPLYIKKSISVSESGIGNIYLQLRQYKLAIEEFKKVIKLKKDAGDILGLAINYQNIGSAKEALGDLDAALKNYEKSLEYNKEIKSKVGKIICNNSIAVVLVKQGKPKEALQKLMTILPLAIKLDDQYYLSNTYNNLGLVQLKLDQFDNAVYNLNNALSISKKYNLRSSETNSYKHLSELYEKRKKTDQALFYYKKYTAGEAQIYNDRNLQYVDNLILKYDSERKNNLIKDLAKQNEIAKLQIARNRNLLIIILGSVLFLGLILYAIYRNRSLQNEKKFLTLRQEALQSQMNPHFVFNALNSIKLYIINNEQKNAVYYLNKFAKLIRKILEASKVKEVSLREELETMALYMSIENIRFGNEINYKTNIDKSLNIDSIKVPPLVLQPFLENSIWHGLSSKKGDKEVTLSVNKAKEGFIKITIEDNGIGREASAKIKANKTLKRKSVGIDITKNRLKNFVKTFEKDFSLRYFDVKNNNKITGTRVNLQLPIA